MTSSPHMPPHGPAAWLAKAKADLALARWALQQPGEPNFDAVGFHAQQAVEKLIKAALVAAGATPAKSHDLVRLANDLTASSSPWRWDTEQLAALSQAAVASRYPGPSLTRDEAQRLLAIAEAIWDNPPIQP